MRDLSFNEVQHVSGADLAILGVVGAALSTTIVSGYSLVAGYNNYDYTKTIGASALVYGMAGGIGGAIVAPIMAVSTVTGIGAGLTFGALSGALSGAYAYYFGSMFC